MSTKHTDNVLMNLSREEVRTRIERFHNQSKEDVKKKMDELREWINNQSDFEVDLPDSHVAFTLARANFNVPLAKEIISNYQNVAKICPEFYYCRDPRSTHMVTAFNTLCYVALPTLTEDLRQIFICKLIDLDPDKFNMTDFVTQVLNVEEIRYYEGCALGDIALIDCTGITVSHMMKMCNLSILMKMKKITKMFAGNYSIAVHFFNMNAITEQLIKAVHLISASSVHKVVAHSDLQSLWKHLDRRLLPKDYGGEGSTFAELRELYWQKLEEYNDRYKQLDNLKMIQVLRAAQLQCKHEEFGAHGSFRKLQVD